ncbi:hypothetical protein NBRC10512_005363 [Rhodotorula toruloides]|uniref:RHTO0S01e08856g1_1 n=2 Tax=Rhodotorula toruloides TaxID=5286 RepID=A0A061AEA4_RHOTO|nr:uncharacterized protein RHTO_04862 [Rhodotorula toruloides NP11]EMS24682.1 hypothetical protein RHTO_04862 [Rhodotorula toruloides NP11]CDR35862.1 RHTO0S01e08856g1_1 [Rhodotorula toruloides]
MNRFRRKSESKQRSRRQSKDDGGSARGGGGAASGEEAMVDEVPSLGSAGLPETADFRTSLILPNLMKRFSLLRGEDGQLVDLVTMQHHLAAQRQTGRLTAHEVDAVLAQYRLQTAAEQSPMPPPTASSSSGYTKRKRIDWSKIDLEELTGSSAEGSTGGGADPSRASIATTASASTTTATPHTSLVPPPHSPAPSSIHSFSSSSPSKTSPLASPSMSRDSSASGSISGTAYPYQYKRGANSLFGARASGEGKRSVGMGKSRSRESTASGSAKGKEREREREGSGDAEGASLEGQEVEGADETLLIQSDPLAFDPADPSGPSSPIPSLQINPSTPTDPTFPPPLSPKQLRRISRALDDIEAELKGDWERLRESDYATSEEEEEGDVEAAKEGEEEMDERADRTNLHHLDVSLDGLSPVSPLEGVPASPTSPITASDLAGLTTFHTSAPADDTEPVDPFYQRASPLPPTRLPPSLPRSSHEILRDRDSMSASLSHSSSLDRLASSTPLPLGTRTTSPTPTPSLSSILIPDRSARVRALSLDTDDDPTGGVTPSTAADEEEDSEDLSPRVKRFPVVERTDSDQTAKAGGGGEELLEVPQQGGEEADKTVSDSGPFDLSLGEGADESKEPESDSRRGSRRRSRMPGAFVHDPAERNSTATLDSVGSSFHGSTAAEHQSEDDVFPPDSTSTSLAAPNSPASSAPTSYAPAMSRPHSLATNVVVSSSPDLAKSSEADGSPSLLRPTSFPLDRRPSNELLQIISEASRNGETGTEPGDTSDLILQDLLLIQEKLVQSAARRAARSASSPNSAMATPSSVASPAEELLASPLAARSALASDPHSLETSPKDAASAPRKASVESSGDATDLGGQLAGLGLSSLMPFDLGEMPDSPPMRRQSNRASMRTAGRGRSEGTGRSQSEAVSEAGEEDDERDSTFLGPASTHMTVQTSQTSSTSPFTNSVVTPSSTEHSDVFEFSSLVGSPESAAWEDAQEHIKPDSFASGSLRTEASPRVDFPDSPNPSASSYNEDAKDTPEGSARVAPPSASTSQTSSLAGPAPIDTESFLRVPRPRNKPMRDPASTPSMLIRDVRNQATLATIALKKQSPASPQTRPLNKSRSIRKGSISSPQLVSGPVDIPAVPILSPQLGAQSPGRSASKSGKKRKDEDEGRKSKGLGSRFKMLLKKPSVRDQLGQLNGDEVTPFVTANPDNAPRTRTSAIPVTPPNQSLARFGSPGFDSPDTPDTVKTAQRDTLPADAPVPALSAVNESSEGVTRSPSLASSSPQIDSPRSGDSHGSGQSRSLSRLMSRMRSNTGGADESATTSPKEDADEASGPVADDSPHVALTSKFLEGLGFGDDVVQGSRAPAQYAVGSPRSRHKAEFETVNGTPIAPLSFTRRPAGDEAESAEPSPSAPSFVAAPPSRASIDSMRKLWQAAEDLGLPRDKVQEFVESAYARSPTTASSHAHAGSTDSTAGRFSAFGSSSGSQRRPSEAPTSADGHWRRPSDFSGNAPLEGLEVPGGAEASALAVPHSPSLGSIVSRRSSEYASSFLDYYANDDEPSPLPRSDSASLRSHGRRPSLAPSVDELLAQQQKQEHTARLQPVAEFDEHPEYGNTERGAPASPTRFENDGEVVWQVLDDLRNNRLSVLSKNSSISFGSRDSSFAFDKQSSDGDQPNGIANLLRHRDRKRSSASMPSEWDGRYPSIYFREEQALINLAEQGGVAPELEGRFLVRPKDQEPEVPPLPEQYRTDAQASASQETEAPSAA